VKAASLCQFTISHDPSEIIMLILVLKNDYFFLILLVLLLNIISMVFDE